MEKKHNCYVLIITLLSCCLCCLILLVIKFMILNKPTSGVLYEIQYLTVSLEQSNKNLSTSDEIDSILIDGGVLRVILSKEYIENCGLSIKNPTKVDSPIECLNVLLNYIGVFGWDMIETNGDIIYFSRCS